MLRYRLSSYLRQRRGTAVLAWMAVLAFAACVLFQLFDQRLKETLDAYIEIRLQGLVTSAVADAISETLSSGGDYSGMVSLSRNAAGGITAIETDTIKLNMLKAAVSGALMRRLGQEEQNEIGIPLGTLLGGSLFLGRGPQISVRLIPAGAASLTFASQFEAAGVNQTLHKIVLETDVAITVIRPGAAVKHSVSQQIVLSETVIVGSVPDSFTYIDLGVPAF